MSTARSSQFIVASVAALAMTVFVNARFAFSQEAPESGTSVDANWDSTGPSIDEDAASADKVLEIPQAKCDNDGTSAPCDAPAASGDDDNDQAINAPSPGSPPQVYDDDTASSGAPDEDWGNADDYQNQQVYAVPYGGYGYPYTINTPLTMNRPSPVPASAYAPMSSPLTQAARPSLNQGPWMTPPTMSAFSRPAGSPMMGMASSPFGFHH
ncbi:hypothetical protein [Candidatus Binatus sp.]|uniref:hypothetical protein n=1 Tax=Candidatus Binatus sp. TaxID=2811406 RepID=UPI003BAFC282